MATAWRCLLCSSACHRDVCCATVPAMRWLLWQLAWRSRGGLHRFWRCRDDDGSKRQKVSGLPFCVSGVPSSKLWLENDKLLASSVCGQYLSQCFHNCFCPDVICAVDWALFISLCFASKTMRFTQRWVRRERVQPFPHIASCCHAYCHILSYILPHSVMRIATYCLAYGHILSCIWPHTVLRIATYCHAYGHILSCILPHTVVHIATYCHA